MKFFHKISALAIIMLLAGTMLSGQTAKSNVTVKISLDSAYVVMGRVTPMTIEVTAPAGLKGYLHAPSDTLVEGVEVAGRSNADTTELPGGRLQIKQQLLLQSFDSGAYIIPPVKYIAGAETIASNQLALKVLPVSVDTLNTIHDYADVASIKARFWDWVPQWITDNWGWILAALILIAGGVVAIVIYRKKLKGRPIVSLRPAPKPVPPYELAVQELNRLHSEKLCENGHEKEFYTRLTDILRNYIEARFHINAVEMSSSEILHALRSNPDTRLPEVYMRQILEIADYVKFARLRPFSDDNAKAFADAMKFVEDTKPRPLAPSEPDESKEQNDH